MQTVLAVHEDRDHPAVTELARTIPFTSERLQESPPVIPQRDDVAKAERIRRIVAAASIAPDLDARVGSRAVLQRQKLNPGFPDLQPAWCLRIGDLHDFAGDESAGRGGRA